MPASSYDVYIEQGATFNLALVWRDNANALVNLTGYTARMQVRKRITDAVPLLDLNTTNGKITLGGTAGTIAITANAAQTAALTDKQGVYDLELVAADGTVVRLLQGDVTISPEVTR